MTLEAKLVEAKQILGHHWVLSPHYRIEANPQHSPRWKVNVEQTFARVKVRQLREVFSEFKRGDPNERRDRSATAKAADLSVPILVHKRPAHLELITVTVRQLWDQSARLHANP